MNLSPINRSIIKSGEELRSRYLYQMQEDKDLVTFEILKHKKKQLIKNKIIKLVQCL